MPGASHQDWLLIFYSVPAHPVSGRMRIWRKLSKAGAVQLKGAVYILPATEEHRELFQWIIGEVKSLGGDGAFVRTSDIETIPDREIRRLFNEQRDREYRELGKSLDNLERKVNVARTASGTGRARLSALFASLRKAYEEITTLDFFKAPLAVETGARIRSLDSTLKGLQEPGTSKKPAPLARKHPETYRSAVWVTRKRPFVDRMASAWLIRRFLNPEAIFRFIDEKDLDALQPGEVAFDMPHGEFSHHGDLCTLEVLVRSFGIKDRAVRKIAEIVHDLDLKDDKFGAPEAKGLEGILSGIRTSAANDTAALEQGIAVFEALYASRR